MLQGFNSTLTMLDGRSGAGGGDRVSDFSGGDDFGSPGPTASRRPAMAGGGGGRSDMDDEIPF